MGAQGHGQGAHRSCAVMREAEEGEASGGAGSCCSCARALCVCASAGWSAGVSGAGISVPLLLFFYTKKGRIELRIILRAEYGAISLCLG